jgi:CheY-like chemotaxis protein
MPDCVVLDVLLPDFDGWEILQRVRANPQTAKIPIIMLTPCSQTRQLNHLVDYLHDMAQADGHQLPLDKTDINMIALIEHASELFEPLASEAGLTLHIYPGADSDTLWGSESHNSGLTKLAGEWTAPRPQSG